MDTVKVKLLHRYISGPPGNPIVIYGHTFVIQPNGEAHCDMHEDFVEAELQAGRIAKVDGSQPTYLSNKPEENMVPTFPKLAGFTWDIGNYFGAGDLKKLIRKVEILNKSEMIEFARIKLSIELPQTMTNKDIVEEIKNTIKQRHNVVNDLSSANQSPNTEENTDALNSDDGEERSEES
jgi:hypothetical protein